MIWFFKTKQKLCANVPKGAPQQHQCVEDKEQFYTKWLQTIYNVKLVFTQKLIPRQNQNLVCFQRITFLY